MNGLHPLSQTILQSFQVRKTGAQKRAFRDFMVQSLAGQGYPVQVQTRRMLVKNNNLIIGDVHKAKVVFTAHYDTCAVLPFPNFITPKCIPLYALYQLLLVAAILGFGFALALFGVWLGAPGFLLPPLFAGFCWLFCILMIAGPANRHTANDNTSGVIAVVETALSLPEELRSSTAFVLFDNEEAGLLGSAAFAAAYPAIKKDTLVVNFDCVSDGDHLMLVLPKCPPPAMEQAIRASFRSQGSKQVMVLPHKGVFYPSDQANFRLGVGAAALRRTKAGLLYLGRLHTPRDTVFEEENIRVFAQGAAELAAPMHQGF